ncbi:MAG: YfhO family protein [Bacteroidota bacterium]|nr:YfhO family protein [Bacteroidota bacterium]MDP4234573.1 YfhO family protein [Bacteroidota bacterium]MDP4243702.1 YfhO family protein [Bacteroidota bacterium]
MSKAAVLRSFSPWYVVGFFVLLTIIFHSDILLGGKFLWEDFVEQEFPFRTLAASSLAQGILPQWNPYVFAGMPFMADIQVAFWYPFNMVQALFVSDGFLSPNVMQWFSLMHFAIAGIGMYWFAKKILAVDDWSAVFAGIAYAFGGYITAQAIHQMIVYHIALFPWVAYFFVRGFDSWRHAIIAGLVLGVMYLAGHPQSTLYFTFLLALLAVYEIVHRLRTKTEQEGPGESNVLPVVRMVLPIVIGLGIFAIQYLPSQELADLSRRDTITYEKSLDGSLSWGHLYTFVLPRLFGVTTGDPSNAKVPYWNGAYYNSWETSIYIGILPLFFAIMAGLIARKRKYVPFLAGIGLLAVLFALGDHFFLYKLFFQLPLFSKFRTPARMMMLFSFAASALGGIGLSEALKSERPKWGANGGWIIRGLLTLPWLLAIAGMLHATSFFKGAPAESQASIPWAAGLATFPVLAMLAVTGLHYLGKLRGNMLATLTIGVTIIELFTYGMSLNASPTDPREAYREQPQLIDMLKQDQAKELSRARTRIGGQMLVRRNQGAYDRIQLVEGYDPLVLQRVFPEMANPEASADLMNIKWSIMPGKQPGFGPRPGYMPRVKLYYQSVVLPDSQALTRLKQDSNFDYRNTILLEEQPTSAIGPADAAGVATVSKYGDNEITVSVTTGANAMLFLSEIYYPAWNAYLDGKPVKLYRAFTSLRAVEVPKGVHTVTLRYESQAFARGSWITIATLVLSLGALGFLKLRKRST